MYSGKFSHEPVDSIHTQYFSTGSSEADEIYDLMKKTNHMIHLNQMIATSSRPKPAPAPVQSSQIYSGYENFYNFIPAIEPSCESYGSSITSRRGYGVGSPF